MIQSNINTPLGNMIAIADEKFLYFLKFLDDQNIQHEISQLSKGMDTSITNGSNKILDQVAHELDLYFCGKLKNFTIPLHTRGTNFQIKSWQALQTIPYGQTISYASQALKVECPNGHRAVANANGRNHIIIIIPCHRIIYANGKLGGYSSGLERKKVLLELEKKYR